MLQSTQTLKPVTEPPLSAENRALVRALVAKWPTAVIRTGRYCAVAKVDNLTVDKVVFPTGMNC